MLYRKSIVIIFGTVQFGTVLVILSHCINFWRKLQNDKCNILSISHVVACDPQVHVVTPTQQEEKSTTLSQTQTTHNIPHISEPTFQDVGAETPRLVEPVYQAIPAGPAPDASLSASSSESTESSESSEELSGSVRAVKPPMNFRYAARRQRRQIPTSTTSPHSPVFLSVFPSVPSPFRSCPGVSRYTTVWETSFFIGQHD